MDPIYTQIYHKYSMKYRRMIDKYIMHKWQRWCFSCLLLVLYIYRIMETQAFFVVTYILSIYGLQLLLKYFTPLGLPDIEEEDEIDYDIQLPQHNDDRPLLRSMSEITIWENWSIALIVANLATFCIIFDLPVYWPFLMSYLIMVMIMTFKRYLQHMQKYGYNWTDFSKR